MYNRGPQYPYSHQQQGGYPQVALMPVSANQPREQPLLSTLLAQLGQSQAQQKQSSASVLPQPSVPICRPEQEQREQRQQRQAPIAQPARQQGANQQWQQTGQFQPQRTQLSNIAGQQSEQRRMLGQWMGQKRQSPPSPLLQEQIGQQKQPIQQLEQQQQRLYRQRVAQMRQSQQQQHPQSQHDIQRREAQQPSVGSNHLESKVDSLNTLTNLGTKLYLFTLPILPLQRRPQHHITRNNLAAWGRLSIPPIDNPTPRQQLYMVLKEAAVIGKVVDVIYILLEINKYRNRQRTEETMTVLREARYMLTNPLLVSELSAAENPHLKCPQFDRATNSMRFHIVCGLLETYAGVLCINEAVWRWKKLELDSMREEELLIAHGGYIKAITAGSERGGDSGYLESEDDGGND